MNLAVNTRALIAAGYCVTIAVFMTVAAWPIYQTTTLIWVVVCAAVLGGVIPIIGVVRAWGAFTLTMVVLAFIFTAAPVTMGLLPVKDLLRNTVDAVAAVGVGWKDLLTLTLPVGTYQAVLVPAYVVTLVVAASGTALIMKGGKATPFATLPAIIPALFGTIFGSSHLSPATNIGLLSLSHPREIGVWVTTFAAVGAWIGFTSSHTRRQALRKGRETEVEPDGPQALRRRQRTRTILGSTILVVALVGATVALVVWDSSSRVVPRDQVEPALLLQDHISPLTSYRVWKQNSHYTTPLFRVSGDDLPPRLRLAVVDSYDGIDFTISTEAEDGRFTRFPSANPTSEMSEVRVDIEEGYADIWVPLAPPLGQRLAFSGPRPLLLEDTFYLNPARGAGIVIGDGDGLKQGDSYTTLMSTTPAPELDAAPISEIPLLDAETHPELFTWLENNSFTPGAKGLTTAVEALRARGYLSHSLELGEETPRWLSQLQEDHEFTFFSSPGGHNTARIEHLFAELNEQDSLLPSDATDKQRIAAIGDDEQFATAAALVARALGYDSRIVIGVRLGDEGAGVEGVPACENVCTGRHIAAWVEVKGENGVWATLDASPQVKNHPKLVESGQKFPEFATQPEQRDATESDPPVGLSDRETTDDPDDTSEVADSPSPWLRHIAISLLILVLFGAVFFYTPGVKAIRTRRRRHAPTPEARAWGAWAELLDYHRDTGEAIPVQASRREVAHSLGVGDTAIATTVDQAMYSHEGLTSSQADGIWEQVHTSIDDHRKRQTRWKRITRVYSRRSFKPDGEQPQRKART